MRTEPSKIESTRESESLKSVLLDAITHDFRSPLTSIKASVTGLLDDLEFDREQRRELLTIINEECDRINRLVGEAAEIARLESGEANLDLASHSVGELLSAALAECKNVTANREVSLDVKAAGLTASGGSIVGEESIGPPDHKRAPVLFAGQAHSDRDTGAGWIPQHQCFGPWTWDRQYGNRPHL
jgi:signal transduction histidine kinase